MTKEQVFEFIKRQKTAIISSVDSEGFPIQRLCFRHEKLMEMTSIFQQTHLL